MAEQELQLNASFSDELNASKVLTALRHAGFCMERVCSICLNILSRLDAEQEQAGGESDGNQ